jgi:hypothetical protein
MQKSQLINGVIIDWNKIDRGSYLSDDYPGNNPQTLHTLFKMIEDQKGTIVSR